ncbi:MAG TPA: hypothetical protein PK574_08285 [Fervidobacterium sp.]|nr:hypothetical protein [Fervidobacterium sp.]HQE48402.1 hypothetical protein [Fervidobacterium sp.]
MGNMRKGFMTAIVLVMMVVVSITLLTLYQGVANYRERAMSTLSSIQNDADSVNILNIGVGFLKPKFLGILGASLLYNDDVPTWFNDFKGKLNQDWQNYITTNVSTTKACKIFDWSSTNNQGTGLIKLESSAIDLLNQITSYITLRSPYQVSLYAFQMPKLGNSTVLLISMVKRQYKAANNQTKYLTTYTYCLVGPKLLNQYVYFTNREKTGQDPIYFTAGEIIDGPMRSNDYIYINNAGGKPTFNGTVEFKGIINASDKIVDEAQYSNYATMNGNPKYRILSPTDASNLDFSSIATEYQNSLQSLVRKVSDLQTPPATPTGIEFNGDITVSFNHGTATNNYDLRIYDGSNTRYTIKWLASGAPYATVKKETKDIWDNSWSKSYEVDTLFNGVICSTGNITINGNSTYLSKYYGNYTLYSEDNIYIRDRLIPYDTYTKYFTNQETQYSGVALDNNTINNIKNYVLANEKSSLNLVASNNVEVRETNRRKPENMKIFASIYAFNGSFRVEDHDSDGSAGQLFTFGSIMQNARGPVGTFDSSSGQTVSGYYKTYVYDPRLTTAAYQPAGTPAKNSSAKIQVLGVVKSSN